MIKKPREVQVRQHLSSGVVTDNLTRGADIKILTCGVEDDTHTSGKLTRGMCAKHYQRARKYGSPVAVKASDDVDAECLVCSSLFRTQSRFAKYCSKRCADKGKPSASGLTCFICGEYMVKGRTSKPQGEAAHNACRAELDHSSNSYVGYKHGASGYKRGCRCEECREAKMQSLRDYVAMVKERDGVSPTQKYRPRKSTGKTCYSCGEEMMWYGGSEKPVHKHCPKPSKRTPGLLHKRFQKKIDKAARGTTGGKRVFVSGACAWCGDNFTASKGVYCTDKCKVKARFKRRSRGFSFNVSPIVRRGIYVRDKWTCQLCMQPVDSSLKHPSLWSATLDHIEPQSSALIPDHSPSNLRLAHLWCNAARGNGSNMVEEELISRATSMIWEAA